MALEHSKNSAAQGAPVSNALTIVSSGTPVLSSWANPVLPDGKKRSAHLRSNEKSDIGVTSRQFYGIRCTL